MTKNDEERKGHFRFMTFELNRRDLSLGTPHLRDVFYRKPDQNMLTIVMKERKKKLISTRVLVFLIIERKKICVVSRERRKIKLFLRFLYH